MTRPQNNPDQINLRDFFQRSYLPCHLAGKSRELQSIHRAALDWFCETVDAAATLADLTADNLASVDRQMIAMGVGNDRRHQVCKSIRGLWRYAQEISHTVERLKAVSK